MRSYLLSSVYDQHGTFFPNRIVMLKYRLSKFIDVKWDYIEKLSCFSNSWELEFFNDPRICLYACVWISVLVCIILCITAWLPSNQRKILNTIWSYEALFKTFRSDTLGKICTPNKTTKFWRSAIIFSSSRSSSSNSNRVVLEILVLVVVEAVPVCYLLKNMSSSRITMFARWFLKSLLLLIYIF